MLKESLFKIPKIPHIDVAQKGPGFFRSRSNDLFRATFLTDSAFEDNVPVV